MGKTLIPVSHFEKIYKVLFPYTVILDVCDNNLIVR